MQNSISISQAPNQFTGLPTEVIWEILLKANPKDIASYCLTSKEANLICTDQSFWREKLWTDFGKQVQAEGIEWKEMYQILSTGGNNSPIAAGNNGVYTIIDNRGNLYMGAPFMSYWDGNSKITINITPAKIPMDSKVISVSQGYNLIGALTESGTVKIWKSYVNNSPGVALGGTINLVKIDRFITGGIKIVILEDGVSYGEKSGYAVILNNGEIYVKTVDYDGYLKPDKTHGKFVDIMMSYSLYSNFGGDTRSYTNLYVLSSFGVLMKVSINSGGQIRYSAINLPEPINKLSALAGNLAALSKNGNVYIWGDIADHVDETISKYKKITTVVVNAISYHGEPIIPIYRVNLAVPIASIYMSINELVAIAIDGKLHRFQDKNINEPTEIDIGYKVKYVAVGDSFSIAVSTDRVVNYWYHK